MRSVWFSLIGPSVSELEQHLKQHGFVLADDGSPRAHYPNGSDAVLYISWEDYEWVHKLDLQEEYAELLAAINGTTPTVHILVDVSGRAKGDDEVRFLARCLLAKFTGFAFDDFLSYSHAWTLGEIESNAIVDGLGFFDYQGHFDRSNKANL